MGGTVWLTFANSAFKQFAINWAAHIYRLRKERSAAIAALDKPFQAALLEERLPFFGYDHGRTGDLRSDVAEFRRLGALKGELVLQVLRADRHVLLSDVDVIWVADPAPILRSLAVHADVMSATDCLNVTGDEAKFPKQAQGVNRCAYNPGNNHGHAAFNTGVVYLRASTAAKAFAAAWRSRLLSVEKSAWLDDQLAFNELVWHGYRNHPDKAIREASPDGKVVAIRMGVSKDDPERPTIPAHEPLPAWKDGWADLMRRPDEAFVEAKDALPAMPLGYHLAPLPARHFCSGHLFWEQQNLEPRGCASIHTTFVEGGNLGKLWRFREAGLWLLDPPSHYEPEGGARYITYDPPHAPAASQLAPVWNTSADPRYTDKYKAGWLVPDALQLSPRLRQHLELARRHILALRDAMALAMATGRTLILPRLPCICDRSEGPLVLKTCKYEASELPMPFTCPLTHLFDIARFAQIRDRPERLGRIDFRESSFLDNPLTPQDVRVGHVPVTIATDAAALRDAHGRGEAAILHGTSDAQANEALIAHASAKVLRLRSAEGVFGGWTDVRARNTFEAVVTSSTILAGSWCCTSWYKPSGSINYATPAPTLALPSGCGSKGSVAAGADGGGALPNAPPAQRQECTRLQGERRRSQQPFEFVYELSKGREGQDGYYRLVYPPGTGPGTQ